MTQTMCGKRVEWPQTRETPKTEISFPVNEALIAARFRERENVVAKIEKSVDQIIQTENVPKQNQGIQASESTSFSLPLDLEALKTKPLPLYASMNQRPSKTTAQKEDEERQWVVSSILAAAVSTVVTSAILNDKPQNEGSKTRPVQNENQENIPMNDIESDAFSKPKDVFERTLENKTLRAHEIQTKLEESDPEMKAFQDENDLVVVEIPEEIKASIARARETLDPNFLLNTRERIGQVFETEDRSYEEAMQAVQEQLGFCDFASLKRERIFAASKMDFPKYHLNPISSDNATQDVSWKRNLRLEIVRRLTHSKTKLYGSEQKKTHLTRPLSSVQCQVHHPVRSAQLQAQNHVQSAQFQVRSSLKQVSIRFE